MLAHELPSIHGTRAELIEPIARQALRAPGRETRALDLGCNEGWFAHRMLDWGATRAVALDVRTQNIVRARLLADHYGIGEDRLELREASVYDLDPEQLGTFDVVLCLGLIYHLEDPIGAVRKAAALSHRLCVVESQLTEQTVPIRHGWGQSHAFEEAPASWAARYEVDAQQELNPQASHGGVVSLIPNAAALIQAMTVAGLRDVQILHPSPHHNAQYWGMHRAVAVGWAGQGQ